MDAGALDRRIEVLRAATLDDGFAVREGEPTVIGCLWAAKRDASDAERFRNGVTEATILTRFHLRWTPFSAAIRASDRLRCEGRTYGVIGVKEIGRREGLEITAMAEGV